MISDELMKKMVEKQKSTNTKAWTEEENADLIKLISAGISVKIVFESGVFANKTFAQLQNRYYKLSREINGTKNNKA